MSEEKNNSVAEAIVRLVDIVDRLRGPGGCPWDREQTSDSLKPFLVEECYELLDAIDGRDPEKIIDELGDVLLQILLHARILKEQNEGNFADVAEHLSEKLVRRHPHVFGEAKASSSADVLNNWEKIKARERESKGIPLNNSAVDGVPRSLPALCRAERVQSKAARVGFDWKDVADVASKVGEELSETMEAINSRNKEELEEEIGDLLFAVVNLARHKKINAEEALHKTTAKFIRRFKEVERRLVSKGRRLSDCSLEEMDAAWEAVKDEERSKSNSTDDKRLVPENTE